MINERGRSGRQKKYPESFISERDACHEHPREREREGETNQTDANVCVVREKKTTCNARRLGGALEESEDAPTPSPPYPSSPPGLQEGKRLPKKKKKMFAKRKTSPRRKCRIPLTNSLTISPTCTQYIHSSRGGEGRGEVHIAIDIFSLSPKSKTESRKNSPMPYLDGEHNDLSYVVDLIIHRQSEGKKYMYK